MSSYTADRMIASYKRGQSIYNREQVTALIEEIQKLEEEIQILQESIDNMGNWKKCPICRHQSPDHYICFSCGFDPTDKEGHSYLSQDVEGY